MAEISKFDRIVSGNRKLNQDALAKARGVAEKSRRMKIKPPKYSLATPMTPRVLPPVDYNNRLTRATKVASQKPAG